MSRRDQITGRGPSYGNSRSHSLRATRRRWNVNLQWATLEINGKKMRIRVSARTLKTLRKAHKNEAAPVAAPAPVAAAPAPAAPAAEAKAEQPAPEAK